MHRMVLLVFQLHTTKTHASWQFASKSNSIGGENAHLMRDIEVEVGRVGLVKTLVDDKWLAALGALD